MATFPAKTNYAAGDVLTAAQMVDIGDQINALNKGAGRNVILNSDFRIWQRGTSITLTNNVNAYGADRFRGYCAFTAGSASFSQQTFTPGTAPVAGYEGQFFARITNGSTATVYQIDQRIEDVRTFANQTVTFSFWAKASSNRTVTGAITQNFGSGGSGNVATGLGNFSITTSWARYTVTFTVPSVSGKTIGTGSYLELAIYESGTTSSVTFDTWGWQLEAGNTATAFQTATGTLAGELAACQRYFQRYSGNDLAFMNTNYYSTTLTFGVLPFITEMRVAPTGAASGNDAFKIFSNGDTRQTSNIAFTGATTKAIRVQGDTTARTAGDSAWIQFWDANAWIEMRAEL